MLSSAARIDVPCGGCDLCCRMLTLLRPEHGDVESDYLTMIVVFPDGARRPALRRKEDGSCIYLGSHGCTIHDRTPHACRTYDCRELFLKHDRRGRKLAVKAGEVDKVIFDRGRELLRAAGQL